MSAYPRRMRLSIVSGSGVGTAAVEKLTAGLLEDITHAKPKQTV